MFILQNNIFTHLFCIVIFYNLDFFLFHKTMDVSTKLGQFMLVKGVSACQYIWKMYKLLNIDVADHYTSNDVEWYNPLTYWRLVTYTCICVGELDFH